MFLHYSCRNATYAIKTLSAKGGEERGAMEFFCQRVVVLVIPVANVARHFLGQALRPLGLACSATRLTWVSPQKVVLQPHQLFNLQICYGINLSRPHFLIFSDKDQKVRAKGLKKPLCEAGLITTAKRWKLSFPLEVGFCRHIRYERQYSGGEKEVNSTIANHVTCNI